MTARLAEGWRRWVALWSVEESPRALAIVRVLVACVLFYDFWKVWDLGLVVTLFGPPDAGGFGDILSRKPIPEVYQWFPLTGATAEGLHAVMLGAIVAFGLGFLTPISGLLALFLSAQFAQVLPLGDRGIDLLLRNVLLLLSLSGCGRIGSIDACLFGRRDLVPAWPRYLLIVQILVMYASAGIQKTAVSWWPLGSYSALYLILQDSAIAAYRFGWLERVFRLTQLAAATTMVFELGAWAMPLAWWYRLTPTRPGRLRAMFNRLKLHHLWMWLGVGLHIGIAATMSLGIFPFAMLALYPAFLHPDELPRWLRGSVKPPVKGTT